MVRKKVTSLITAALVMAACLGVSYPNKVNAKDNAIKVTEKFNSSVKVQSEKANISEKEALKIVVSAAKNYFDYTVNTGEYRVSYDFSKNEDIGEYEWNVELTKSEKGGNISISADINADTGEVTQFRKYKHSEDGSDADGGYSVKKAQQNAQEFLTKFFSDKTKEVKLLNNNLDIYDSGNYYFHFARVENNVLCSSNYIEIEVDDTTGEIIGFEYDWDKDLKAPDTSKTISSDAALANFKKNVKAQLRYIPYTDKYKYNSDSSVQDTKLVYDISNLSQYSVDAKSGKFIDANKSDNAVTVTKNLTKAEKKAWLKKASTPVYHENEINAAAAKKVVNKYIKAFYGSGYKIYDLNYSRDDSDSSYGTGNGVWRADFYENNGKNAKYDYNSIGIDAKTETILYLSHYDKEDSKVSVKVSYDKAYKKATDLIAKYYPEKMKLVDTKQSYTTVKGEDVGSDYTFSFIRNLNGIPYSDNTIDISIAKDDGTIEGLGENWTKNLKYLFPQSIKTEKDAVNIALEKYSPQLTYSKTNGKYVLSYTLIDKENGSYYPFIDAATGKILGYTGNELPEVSQDFLNKIKDSEYADALTALAYKGVIDTSTFDMTKSITRLDFYKMLVNARGYDVYSLSDAPSLKYKDVASGSTAYKYLQLAVYYGFLDNADGNFDEDVPISREDMAVVFMKVLGYTNITNNNKIFKLDTSDAASVDSSKLGAVAMADAFGILKENNNTIRPKDNATMVEAAVGIYSVLSKIQG